MTTSNTGLAKMDTIITILDAAIFLFPVIAGVSLAAFLTFRSLTRAA